MFEKFGEFSSVEELNHCAAGLWMEGDRESIFALAEENGLDREDAEDYLSGVTHELASGLMAARGRIRVERKESGLPEEIKSVLYTQAEAMLLSREDFRNLVLKKGYRLEKVVEQMREEAKKHKTGSVGCVCGTDRDLEERILRYYREEA